MSHTLHDKANNIGSMLPQTQNYASQQSQIINDKQYTVQALTPSHKFKSEVPPVAQLQGKLNGQGQNVNLGARNQSFTTPHQQQPPAASAVLSNNIILNINGTTNINHFQNAVAGQYQGPQTIQGKKMDRPKQVRMGKDDSNGSGLEKHGGKQRSQISGQGMVASSTQQISSLLNSVGGAQVKPGMSTMIPKKLLNQAKSAKNARVTPKAILQKQAKALQNKSGLNESMKQPLDSTQNTSQYQTGRMMGKKKALSQFDFNFASTQGTSAKQQGVIGTIDYDKDQRRGTLHPGSSGIATVETTAHTANRVKKSAQGDRKQSINTQQKSAKSSRPTGNANSASATGTKHRRNKSEVRKSANQPVAKPKTTLAQMKQTLNKQKRVNKFEQNKENQTQVNWSGERRSGNQQLGSNSQNSRAGATNKSYNQQRNNQEGLSISSFSSGSNKQLNAAPKGCAPTVQPGGKHSKNGPSIAEQLSKSYFLNSGQLLRSHLSPVRFDSQINKYNNNQANNGSTAPPTSQLEVESGLSQRQQQQRLRGRNRSTAVTHASVVPRVKPNRKNHSHSQSRSNNQGLQTIRNNVAPQMQSIMPPNTTTAAGTSATAADSRVIKSKSANLSQPVTTTNKSQNSKQVDKLIQANIRKNKSKQEEECIKKQLEQFRQQQRRAELSQRNQEVRKINASKIVNHGGAAPQLGPTVQVIDQMLAPGRANMRESDRRRSQSCIEYSNKKGGTASGGDRRAHHSQGPNRQPVQPPKPIPNTTTNRTQKPPRSFVDEINQLTHQVEQEIGYKGSGAVGPPARPVQQQRPGHKRSYLNESNDISIAGVGHQLNLSNSQGISQLQQKKIKEKAARPSAKIHKFIERKKREEQVKRSLELTIEVDKHHKIQKNLNNLDRYVKKHMRQRSQPAIASKKTAQKKTKKDKTNRNNNDAQIVGLSQIFHQPGEMSVIVDQDRSAGPIYHPDISFKHQGISTNHSMLAESQLLQDFQYKSKNKSSGRPKAQKKPTSTSLGSKNATTTKVKKPEKVPQTASHRIEIPRKPSAQTAQNHPKIPRQHVKQVDPNQRRPQAATRPARAIRPSHENSRESNYADKSSRLAQKHPAMGGPTNDYMGQPQMAQLRSELPPNLSIGPVEHPAQHANSQNEAYTRDHSQNSKLSPKSTEHIRRVHELVALYRCRLKPHASDASVMGTLHSAASVIQIHFRYMRHLREAGLRQPSAAGDKRQDDSRLAADPPKSSSRYIDSEISGSKDAFNQLVRIGAMHSESPNQAVIQDVSRLSSDYIDTTGKGKKSIMKERQSQESHLSRFNPSNLQAVSGQGSSSKQEIVDRLDWYPSEGQDGFPAGFHPGEDAVEMISNSRFQDDSRDGSGGLQHYQPDEQAEYVGGRHKNQNRNQQRNQRMHQDSREENYEHQPEVQVDNMMHTSSENNNQRLPSKQYQASKNNRSMPTSSKPRSLGNRPQQLDVAAIEQENHRALLHDRLQKTSSSSLHGRSPATGDALNSGKGLKTPQVPELDLKKLRGNKGKSQPKDQLEKEESKQKKKQDGIHIVIQDQQSKVSAGAESPYSYHGNGEAPQTASSYSGIFNRMGLPLPRSARVKVDYDLVQKDPMIAAQLKAIVQQKDLRGQQVIEEGRRDNLITERTYEVNRKRLERWVTASYNKIDAREKPRSSRRPGMQTHAELIQAAEEERLRLQSLQKLASLGEGDRQSAHSTYGRPSGPQSGRLSQSWRGAQPAGGVYGTDLYQQPGQRNTGLGEPYTDRDADGPVGYTGQAPGLNSNRAIGSGRLEPSKLVGMINGGGPAVITGDSSGTSGKRPKGEGSASDSRKYHQESSSQRAYDQEDGAVRRLDDIGLQIIDPKERKSQHRLSDPDARDDQLLSLPDEYEQNDFVDHIHDEYIRNIIKAGDTRGPDEDGLGDRQNDSSPQIESQEGSRHQRTEKSLNRSRSQIAMPKDLSGEIKGIKGLNENSEDEEDQNRVPSGGRESRQNQHDTEGSPILEPEDIEIKLETELLNQQRKSSAMSNQQQQPDVEQNMDNIRDPRFFTQKVGEEIAEHPQVSDQIGHLNLDQDSYDDRRGSPGAKSQKENAAKPENQSPEPRSGQGSSRERATDETPGTNLSNTVLTEGQPADKSALFALGTSSYLDTSSRSPKTSQKLIKVENQQSDDAPSNASMMHNAANPVDAPPDARSKTDAKQDGGRSQLTVDTLDAHAAPTHPTVLTVSPMSGGDSQGFESRIGIQTGAHSLSSTDSDMAKAISAAHKDVLDSPPDLISPKAQPEKQLMPEGNDDKTQQADQIADWLLAHLEADMRNLLEAVVPRYQLPQQRPMPSIKFFEKKGIKTDLFAIEKYVDEVLEEVKGNRREFMEEIYRPLSRDALEALFQMQNSEIGSYEHFQSNLPPVLSLDLYLKLEKRRKESRENPNSNSKSPDGEFDFERVTDEELREDGVDKGFLAECQHIHNKVLFDCINDSLQQFRPHGKDGPPMSWSRLGRKLKPTEDFTLEEMFEITKHDLFRMAIMQAGTLPRREFVFADKFDDELFAEIREKKLATLLCREIVETEPQWLKWDFEEAQTKIDIADMVLESLVTETIDFLNLQAGQTLGVQR